MTLGSDTRAFVTTSHATLSLSGATRPTPLTSLTVFAFLCIVFLLISRHDMFKSSKGTYPSTPKMNSISLPDDPGALSWFRSATKASSKPKNVLQHFLPQRSMTPAPERVRRDSLSTSHSSRTRTSSLSSTSSQAPLKSILKPPKVEIPFMSSTPYIPPTSKNIVPTQATPTAGQFRPPIMPDGRHHSMPAVSRSRRSSQVGHPPVESSDPAKPGWRLKSKPSNESYADPPPSSRHHSYSKSRRESASGGSDYVLVTEAPLKDEAISLSWPLLDNSQRKRDRQPPLYFDIGFDPRYDMNVRIYRGGVYSRMTAQEGEIPVSSHCTVTKMIIVCKDLSRWPVIVERREGLRCLDVFYGIYRTFHEPLTTREKREIDHTYLDRCQSSFEQRCRDSPGLPEWNRQQGLRRVDLLRGNRIFKGIKQSGSEWTLTMDRQ